MTTSFRGKFPEPPSVRSRGRRARTAGNAHGTTAAALTFPSDLGAHYTLFQFHRYTFQRQRQARRITEGAIALPPPTNITEKHNVQYNNTELGFIGGVGMGMAGTAVQNYLHGGGGAGMDGGATRGGAGVSSLITSLKDEATKAFTGLKNSNTPDKLAAASAALRQGNGIVPTMANMAFGNAPNPHITAVFRGVALNEHTFNWSLSPRSATESTILTDIIHEFKMAALPSYHDVAGTTGALLTFPKVASILYMGGADRRSLYQFKDSVIKGITAEYAPNGPSFFAGTGAPTHINLSLSVQEIQIHTSDDHESALPTPTGAGAAMGGS